MIQNSTCAKEGLPLGRTTTSHGLSRTMRRGNQDWNQTTSDNGFRGPSQSHRGPTALEYGPEICDSETSREDHGENLQGMCAPGCDLLDEARIRSGMAGDQDDQAGSVQMVGDLSTWLLHPGRTTDMPPLRGARDSMERLVAISRLRRTIRCSHPSGGFIPAR